MGFSPVKFHHIIITVQQSHISSILYIFFHCYKFNGFNDLLNDQCPGYVIKVTTCDKMKWNRRKLYFIIINSTLLNILFNI